MRNVHEVALRPAEQIVLLTTSVPTISSVPSPEYPKDWDFKCSRCREAFTITQGELIFQCIPRLSENAHGDRPLPPIFFRPAPYRIIPECAKLTIVQSRKQTYSMEMPSTGERREITRRVNAKEAETIQQSKELASKTRRFSALADTKNLERRNQQLNGLPRVRKSMP